MIYLGKKLRGLHLSAWEAAGLLGLTILSRSIFVAGTVFGEVGQRRLLVLAMSVKFHVRLFSTQ